MRKIIILFLLSLCVQLLFAEEKQEETNSIDTSSITNAFSELVLQVSSLPEIKIEFTEHFVFPFLQGEILLTKDNNIDLALTAEFSPISLNAIIGICLQFR